MMVAQLQNIRTGAFTPHKEASKRLHSMDNLPRRVIAILHPKHKRINVQVEERQFHVLSTHSKQNQSPISSNLPSPSVNPHKNVNVYKSKIVEHTSFYRITSKQARSIANQPKFANSICQPPHRHLPPCT